METNQNNSTPEQKGKGIGPVVIISIGLIAALALLKFCMS